MIIYSPTGLVGKRSRLPCLSYQISLRFLDEEFACLTPNPQRFPPPGHGKGRCPSKHENGPRGEFHGLSTRRFRVARLLGNQGSEPPGHPELHEIQLLPTDGPPRAPMRSNKVLPGVLRRLGLFCFAHGAGTQLEAARSTDMCHIPRCLEMIATRRAKLH